MPGGSEVILAVDGSDHCRRAADCKGGSPRYGLAQTCRSAPHKEKNADLQVSATT